MTQFEIECRCGGHICHMSYVICHMSQVRIQVDESVLLMCCFRTPCSSQDGWGEGGTVVIGRRALSACDPSLKPAFMRGAQRYIKNQDNFAKNCGQSYIIERFIFYKQYVYNVKIHFFFPKSGEIVFGVPKNGQFQKIFTQKIRHTF